MSLSDSPVLSVVNIAAVNGPRWMLVATGYVSGHDQVDGLLPHPVLQGRQLFGCCRTHEGAGFEPRMGDFLGIDHLAVHLETQPRSEPRTDLVGPVGAQLLEHAVLLGG